MGNRLEASYRLLYYQPKPEDGERICIALLFYFKQDIDVLYYADFPRLRCIAPQVDPELIQIYLDDLTANAKKNPSQINDALRRHTPHIIASPERKSIWPLSNEFRLHLMKRFLGLKGKMPKVLEISSETKEDQVKEHLREIMHRANISDDKLKENVTPKWVFGEKIRRHIKTIAFGVRNESGVILIDGVDLSVKSKQAVAARVGKVAYAFFQYDRVRQLGFADRQVFKRVGVILNGAAEQGPDYRDSHDFALAEFRDTADETIDATSPMDLQKLEGILGAK